MRNTCESTCTSNVGSDCAGDDVDDNTDYAKNRSPTATHLPLVSETPTSSTRFLSFGVNLDSVPFAMYILLPPSRSYIFTTHAEHCLCGGLFKYFVLHPFLKKSATFEKILLTCAGYPFCAAHPMRNTEFYFAYLCHVYEAPFGNWRTNKDLCFVRFV